MVLKLKVSKEEERAYEKECIDFMRFVTGNVTYKVAFTEWNKVDYVGHDIFRLKAVVFDSEKRKMVPLNTYWYSFDTCVDLVDLGIEFDKRNIEIRNSDSIARLYIKTSSDCMMEVREKVNLLIDDMDTECLL